MSDDIKGYQDTIGWYNANAKKYAESIEKLSNPDLLDRFARALHSRGLVLDAGCAAGRDCQLLRERGLKPIGIDISRAFVEIAQKKHPDISFVHGDFFHLPFEDEYFDGVWAHASLVHFETLEEVRCALKELYRVLKKGGSIHIFVKEQQGNKKTEIVADAVSRHNRFFYWFTRDEIKSLLEEAGFTIEDLQNNYADHAGRSEVKWIVALAKKIIVDYDTI